MNICAVRLILRYDDKWMDNNAVLVDNTMTHDYDEELIPITSPTLLVNCLQALIQDNRQAQKAYEFAAGLMQTPCIKRALHEYAMVREDFIRELEAYAEVIGQAPCPMMAAHMPTFPRTDEVSVLEQVRKIEHDSLLSYEKILFQGVPTHLQQVLQFHYEKLMDTNRDLRSLQSSYA